MKQCFLFLLFLTAFSCSDKIDYEKEWNNFTPPSVELVIVDSSHDGVVKYLKLIEKQGFKDIEEWVQHCCKAVAKELYNTAKEANAKDVKKITYKLNDGGALSYKGGAPPHIEIGFDLNYLLKFIDEHSLAVAGDELYGVLCHEITHGYQQEPNNAGIYENGSEFFAFIEGTADLARLKTGGFNPPRFPSIGGNYKSGYNVTAFFYLWITETIDSRFLVKLNKTAKEMEVWTFEKAVQQLYGRSAETLWQQYQDEIDYYPWK